MTVKRCRQISLMILLYGHWIRAIECDTNIIEQRQRPIFCAECGMMTAQKLYQLQRYEEVRLFSLLFFFFKKNEELLDKDRRFSLFSFRHSITKLLIKTYPHHQPMAVARTIIDGKCWLWSGMTIHAEYVNAAQNKAYIFKMGGNERLERVQLGASYFFLNSRWKFSLYWQLNITIKLAKRQHKFIHNWMRIQAYVNCCVFDQFWCVKESHSLLTSPFYSLQVLVKMCDVNEVGYMQWLCTILQMSSNAEYFRLGILNIDQRFPTE